MKNKTKHPLFRTWVNMICRCKYQSTDRYMNYGGRGVSVCDRWAKSFDDFVLDMGERPDGFSLDRIDVNGNYEPSNCRWASRSTQSRNTTRAQFLTVDGVEYHVKELSEKTGINQRTISIRHSRGWPIDRILSNGPQWNNKESQKKAVSAHAEMKRSQTHCKHGHEFTEENTYLYKGRRHCRKCRSAMDKFLYYKRTRPLSDFL